MSKRYFINNLDTRIGRSLLSELVKQPVDQPEHMCTMLNQNVQKPNGIKKILKRAKPKLSKKKMLQQCDVYVYSLQDTDINDIKFALNSLDKGAQQQKVLILISDVRVWSNSGKKKVLKKSLQQENNKEDGQQREDGENQQNIQQNKQQSQKISQKNSQKSHEDEQNEGQQKNEEGQDKKQQQIQQQQDPYEYVAFQQQDYLQRKPLEQYEYIKQTEDLLLNFKRQNVKIIIVCPGILYGQGEHTFQSLFKSAWLQTPKKLPYLGQGTNILPTIHISDLSKFIIKLAQSPPEQKIYFNAFDLTQDRSQKAIIQNISRGIGSGLIESVQNSQIITDSNTFRLDIHVETSKQLIGTQQQPVEFQWTSKHGLHESIKSVLQQFCTHHNLRPINILSYVNQSDIKQSNYQTILSEIQSQYRIPILRSENILAYALQHLEGEFKLDLQDQYQAICEYLKEKKSRPLDQTLKVYYRVLKWRLSQNDCATRGYILDGEPLYQEQFKRIFLPSRPSILRRKIKRPKPESSKQQPKSQQDLQQNEKNSISQRQNQNQQQKQPQQQQQEQQPEQQQQQEQQAENDDDQDKPKRQVFYPESIIVIKNLNSQKHQIFEVVEYLSLNGTQQLLYNSIGKPQLIVLQSLRSYIQRNGRPNNYLIHEDILKERHENYYKQLNNVLKQQKEYIQAKDKALVDSERQHRQNIAQQVYKMIQGQGQFQIKKMPFRNYLMQFVVPTLNESLLQVSNIIPNDPVQLLAQYLYQRSYES